VSHPPALAAPTEPFSAGDRLENPCTGELGVLVKAPWEGDDPSLEADLHVQPGGDVVEIPRGSWHDWWNAGEEVGVARVRVSDGARFGQMIETLFGLARDGHTNEKGMPDPLQLAMFAAEFRDVLVLKRPPAAVQSLAFGVLRPIARARGYRGTYPQYGRSLIRS
jgi:hypothetical protein